MCSDKWGKERVHVAELLKVRLPERTKQPRASLLRYPPPAPHAPPVMIPFVVQVAIPALLCDRDRTHVPLYLCRHRRVVRWSRT